VVQLNGVRALVDEVDGGGRAHGRGEARGQRDLGGHGDLDHGVRKSLELEVDCHEDWGVFESEQNAECTRGEDSATPHRAASRSLGRTAWGNVVTVEGTDFLAGQRAKF
jgi:hypothetical protein